MRSLLKSLLILLLVSFTLSISAQEDKVEILWDEWGVPHIYSPDNEGIFYGFGWAQAHLHADAILQLYGEARGRAAEYWGEDYLESDIEIQTLRIPEQGIAAYDALEPEFQAYIDAFAAGFNAYIEAHPGFVSEQYTAVLPITPQDVVTHGVRVIRYEFLTGGYTSAAQSWQRGELTANAALLEGQPGSNAWAISPSRSASGNAMLMANPHQPWYGWGRWVEAHFITPDFELYGAGLMGTVILGVGFNRDIAWSHTVNTVDGWDLYELTLSDDGTGYQYDGETLPLNIKEKTLRVLQDDGTLRDMPLTVKSSIHGPVVIERDDHRALALRVVADNGLDAAVEWWNMGQATNLAEFEEAMHPVDIPMFTTMYADKAGNTMMLFNAQVPIRQSGDWMDWSGEIRVRPSTPVIIPGDTSQTLWTEYHPYEDLPRLINPESGWMQNANEPPYTTTIPIPFQPADFPAYMLPPPYVLPRSTHALRLLSGDESITYDELVDYKFSTEVESARWILDDLIALARDEGGTVLNTAADVLENWDRHANADSKGGVLYTLWAVNYFSEPGFAALADQWSIDDPLTEPGGFADPQAALDALRLSATQLILNGTLGNFGIDAAYGDVFRLRFGDVDLPGVGGNDLLGTISIVTPRAADDGLFEPYHGDSFIYILEFSDPIRVGVLLTHGNATQPGSPHIGDQLALFADHQLRPAWLTREEIESHLESMDVLER